MQPSLIDYKLIQKELNLKPNNIEPPKKKLLITHVPKKSNSIFTFNFFINLVGILSIFIGLYILNHRKINKTENKKEYENKINELAKRVNTIV